MPKEFRHGGNEVALWDKSASEVWNEDAKQALKQRLHFKQPWEILDFMDWLQMHFETSRQRKSFFFSFF